MHKVLVVVLFFVLTAFAGCTKDTSPTEADERSQPDRPADTAPGRVEGIVQDADGPVEGAAIAIVRLGASTTTDAEGAFALDDLSPGRHALQVDTEHHRRAYEDIVVESDRTTTTTVTIELIMLAPGVPLRDGFAETPVVATDSAVVSIGSDAPRLVATNGTLPDPEGNTSMPGWWTVPPHDEAHAAYFVVTLSWNVSSTSVALRVAHGDPQNEPTDVANSTPAPMEPEPVLEGPNFRHYRFENPEVVGLGKQPWHFGVYAAPNESALPVAAERFVDHTIVVQVVYLVDEAVEASDQ